MQQGGFSPNSNDGHPSFRPRSPRFVSPIYQPFDQPGTPPFCHGGPPIYSTPQPFNPYSEAPHIYYQHDRTPPHKSDFISLNASGSPYGRFPSPPQWSPRGRRSHGHRPRHFNQMRFGSPNRPSGIESYIKPSFLQDPWAHLFNLRNVKSQDGSCSSKDSFSKDISVSEETANKYDSVNNEINTCEITDEKSESELEIEPGTERT